MLHASPAEPKLINRDSLRSKLNILVSKIQNAFVSSLSQSGALHEKALYERIDKHDRGLRETPWETIKLAFQLLEIGLVRPIVTTAVVICIEIPFTIIHHVFMTVANLLSALYKQCTTALAKNDVATPFAPNTSNSTSSNTPVSNAIASLYAKLTNNPITSAYNMFCASSTNAKTQDMTADDESLDVNPYRQNRVDFV